MKFLILLILLFFLLAIFATRYRRRIKTAIEIWGSLTKDHQNRQNQQNTTEQIEKEKEVPLVKCQKCGNWVAQKNALNFNSGTYYCSSNCMEKATVVN